MLGQAGHWSDIDEGPPSAILATHTLAAQWRLNLAAEAPTTSMGTLHNPDRFPPDAHILTRSKQLWVFILGGSKRAEQSFRIDTILTEHSLQRRRVFMDAAGLSLG